MSESTAQSQDAPPPAAPPTQPTPPPAAPDFGRQIGEIEARYAAELKRADEARVKAEHAARDLERKAAEAQARADQIEKLRSKERRLGAIGRASGLDDPRALGIVYDDIAAAVLADAEAQARKHNGQVDQASVDGAMDDDEEIARRVGVWLDDPRNAFYSQRAGARSAYSPASSGPQGRGQDEVQIGQRLQKLEQAGWSPQTLRNQSDLLKWFSGLQNVQGRG